MSQEGSREQEASLELLRTSKETIQWLNKCAVALTPSHPQERKEHEKERGDGKKNKGGEEKKTVHKKIKETPTMKKHISKNKEHFCFILH
jgi:hypothetical protein